MSNVPMTRPEEMLAEHKTPYRHSSSFVELNDGRILHVALTNFTHSEDGGLTWSEPYERRDANGDIVYLLSSLSRRDSRDHSGPVFEHVPGKRRRLPSSYTLNKDSRVLVSQYCQVDPFLDSLAFHSFHCNSRCFIDGDRPIAISNVIPR